MLPLFYLVIGRSTHHDIINLSIAWYNPQKCQNQLKNIDRYAVGEMMTLEEIEFELELAGLSREQQVKLLSFVKMNGFDAKMLDKKLQLMGYEAIFTIYDE